MGSGSDPTLFRRGLVPLAVVRPFWGEIWVQTARNTTHKQAPGRLGACFWVAPRSAWNQIRSGKGLTTVNGARPHLKNIREVMHISSAVAKNLSGPSLDLHTRAAASKRAPAGRASHGRFPRRSEGPTLVKIDRTSSKLGPGRISITVSYSHKK